MDLDDVGKQVEIDSYQHYNFVTITPTIIMGITAPRGKMFLFDRAHTNPDICSEAIKAFMEQHKED